MKICFWLLDLNYNSRDNSPEIWIWGIDSEGNRILLVENNFVDYFYAITLPEVDLKQIAEKIRQSYKDEILKIEIVSRRFFGKRVQALKIYCNEVAHVSKQLRSFEELEKCLEDDIRSTMRYLIDNEVVPCSWHEAEVEALDNNYGARVNKVFHLKSPPKAIDNSSSPPIKILGLSIICYSKEGSPKPERNPVIIISTFTNSGEERQFLANGQQEDTGLLLEFAEYVQTFDPDIIASYSSKDLDLNYLRKRCENHGIRLNIDRIGKEPHTSVYGHISLTGIAQIDVADFAEQFPQVKVKTLENLADHLGITKAENRQTIIDIDFPEYWQEPKKRNLLRLFALDNARSTEKIMELMLDFAAQLSSLVSLPLDHVMKAAVGFRVDWFLMKYAHKIGELIPKRTEQAYIPYVGGIVLQPQAGLHENISVLDFKSMYPNIMIAYNLSPDTYISPNQKELPENVYITPEINHHFRKEPPGFFKEVLTYLISVRKEIRRKIKDQSPKSTEHKILNARQQAVKIITNATYGYTGWTGARWYSKPVAESATAYGRYTILEAVNMAKKIGLEVIYGDTDSLFISFDEKKTSRLKNKIEKGLGMDIEIGDLYKKIFFTEAKKRYAGLHEDGTLDIVGLEIIRGDWAEVAKSVQEKVIEIILKEESPSKAKSFVLNEIEKLNRKEICYRDLIVWKTLTRPIEKYAAKTPHVEAARFLKEKGWKISVGDKVGYVVLKGVGRLYTRVKPYMFASIEDVDTDYYVEKQIVPAAARILSFFGVTEEELLSKEKRTKQGVLSDFMRS